MRAALTLWTRRDCIAVSSEDRTRIRLTFNPLTRVAAYSKQYARTKDRARACTLAQFRRRRDETARLDRDNRKAPQFPSVTRCEPWQSLASVCVNPSN